MRSSLGRTTMIMILLAVMFVPGLLQARTLTWERASFGPPAVEQWFFSMAWNLLTDLFDNSVRVSPRRTGLNKNGGQMDPSGAPAPGGNTATTPPSDNGGQMDPSGGR